jgi:hypothetical protein
MKINQYLIYWHFLTTNEYYLKEKDLFKKLFLKLSTIQTLEADVIYVPQAIKISKGEWNKIIHSGILQSKNIQEIKHNIFIVCFNSILTERFFNLPMYFYVNEQ